MPGGRSDQRLKELSHLLIMKKIMKSWWEILSEVWPAGIEGSPGYFSSSLPGSTLFSTQFFKLIFGCTDLHGGAQAPYRGGFSCCRARAPSAWALVVRAHRLRVVECRPSCPSAGIKPMSPALAGRLPTPGPPGKSPQFLIMMSRKQVQLSYRC